MRNPGVTMQPMGLFACQRSSCIAALLGTCQAKLGHQRDLDSALRSADLAMYKAKESGRSNVQFFEPDMNTQVRHRLTMEHAQRSARAYLANQDVSTK